MKTAPTIGVVQKPQRHRALRHPKKTKSETLAAAIKTDHSFSNKVARKTAPTTGGGKMPQRYFHGFLSLRLLKKTKSETLAAAMKTDHSFWKMTSMGIPQKLRTHSPSTFSLYKLKIMVIHGKAKAPSVSILSVEDKNDKETTFNYPPSLVFPVASCHEYMLTVKNECDDDIVEFALWKPSTKELMYLSRPPLPRPCIDYSFQDRLIGLGFDPKTDDYKVIRILYFDLGDFLAELFSLNAGTWKSITYPLADSFVRAIANPVHINGLNYWAVFSGEGYEHLFFLSFDFANESFPSALIPGPPHMKLLVERHCFVLAEIDGSLALVVFDKHKKLLELFVLDKENELWSERGAWTVQAKTAGLFAPLAFLKGHLFYFEDSKGELVLFDCANKKLKKLGLRNPGSFPLAVFPFVGDCGCPT